MGIRLLFPSNRHRIEFTYLEQPKGDDSENSGELKTFKTKLRMPQLKRITPAVEKVAVEVACERVELESKLIAAENKKAQADNKLAKADNKLVKAYNKLAKAHNKIHPDSPRKLKSLQELKKIQRPLPKNALKNEIKNYRRRFVSAQKQAFDLSLADAMVNMPRGPKLNAKGEQTKNAKGELETVPLIQHEPKNGWFATRRAKRLALDVWRDTVMTQAARLHHPWRWNEQLALLDEQFSDWKKEILKKIEAASPAPAAAPDTLSTDVAREQLAPSSKAHSSSYQKIYGRKDLSSRSNTDSGSSSNSKQPLNR